MQRHPQDLLLMELALVQMVRLQALMVELILSN
jgi:hypothetical protein